MKRIKVLTAALLIGAGSLLGQSKKEVKVEGFTAIEAGSAIQVIVTMGNTEGVVFEATEDALPKMKAEVKKGELHLYIEGELKNYNGNLKAYVSAKTLNELSVNGAASIEIKEPLTVDKIALDASGAGMMKLEVNAKIVVADVSGAAQITIKGKTTDLKATASGAANLKAEDLKAVNVDVTATGAGNAKVNVSESLNATASGAGNINYTGEPKKSQVNAKTAGTVRKS
jgi:hypothetical protein